MKLNLLSKAQEKRTPCKIEVFQIEIFVSDFPETMFICNIHKPSLCPQIPLRP